MARNKQQVPTTWLLGLGAGALVLLFLRKRRSDKQSECYAKTYNATMTSLMGAGTPRTAAHVQADAAAKAACERQY